eukprot:133781_1
MPGHTAFDHIGYVMIVASNCLLALGCAGYSTKAMLCCKANHKSHISRIASLFSGIFALCMVSATALLYPRCKSFAVGMTIVSAVWSVFSLKRQHNQGQLGYPDLFTEEDMFDPGVTTFVVNNGALAVIDLGSNFEPMQVAAGRSHTCALSTNNTIKPGEELEITKKQIRHLSENLCSMIHDGLVLNSFVVTIVIRLCLFIPNTKRLQPCSSCHHQILWVNAPFKNQL